MGCHFIIITRIILSRKKTLLFTYSYTVVVCFVILLLFVYVYIAVQCNLDYPDFVYPDPQLSRLAGDQKVHYHACAEDVANDSYGCGYRLSDELWTLQACLGQN